MRDYFGGRAAELQGGHQNRIVIDPRMQGSPVVLAYRADTDTVLAHSEMVRVGGRGFPFDRPDNLALAAPAPRPGYTYKLA